VCLGKGVPDDLMTNNNKAFPLPQQDILPTAADLVAAYENQGGHLTCPKPYGVDLLANHPGLQQQRLMQKSRFSSFDTIFHHLVKVSLDYLRRGCSISWIPLFY